MKSKEFDKCVIGYRRSVGKQFGFKSCDYISYRIVEGYFFCLYHLDNHSVTLEVKPVYSDDLWCDVFLVPGNKKPMSLRGLGAFVVPAEQIGEYDTFGPDWKNLTEQDVETIWTAVFNFIETTITDFIARNPSADTYIPWKNYGAGGVTLVYLMYLLHNNKPQEVIDIIHDEQKKGRECEMATVMYGRTVDGYTFILNYAHTKI